MPLVQIDAKEHLQDFKVLFKTLEESKATGGFQRHRLVEMCLGGSKFQIQELLLN